MLPSFCLEFGEAAKALGAPQPAWGAAPNVGASSHPAARVALVLLALGATSRAGLGQTWAGISWMCDRVIAGAFWGGEGACSHPCARGAGDALQGEARAAAMLLLARLPARRQQDPHLPDSAVS